MFKMIVGLVFMVFIALLAESASIASEDKPGLYRLNGWDNSRYAIDINGEVGHPVYVDGPRSKCVPLGTTMNKRIASGSLPLGLALNNENGDITGIPTDRGHWIVKLEAYNVRCNDQSYEGFVQELRFHITGSGKVVQ